MAELWGVYEGLTYVRRLGFQAVKVEVDSSLVVNIFNSNKNGSIMSISLVAKIRRFLQMDWWCAALIEKQITVQMF